MAERRTQVRVGLWGIGAHAQRYLLPGFAEASNVALTAVHTRKPDVLERTAASTGARAYRSVEEFLEADDVDVVYLATPTGYHFAGAMAVIEAGKDVWCEKPITIDHADTAALMAAAAANGKVALETDMFLHHPQFHTLMSLLESGRLGEVHSVTGRFGFPHRESGDFRYSVEMGGGALLDAGFYPLAAAVAILGSDLQLSGAVINTEPAYEVDTGGSALLSAGGAAAFLGWGFGRAYRSDIEVWCEQGTVVVSRAFAKPSDLETELCVRHQSGASEVIPIPAASQFALMLDDFAVATVARADDGEMLLARSRLLTAIRDAGVSKMQTDQS